jgi:WD40 repeat protein
LPFNLQTSTNGFAKHGLKTNQVQWSPKAPHTLATTSSDHGVLLWDQRDGGSSPAAIFGSTNNSDEALWFDFAADGDFLTVSDSHGRGSSHLNIYDLRKNQPIANPIILQQTTTQVRWLPSSNVIAASNSAGKLVFVSASAFDSPSPPTASIHAHSALIWTLQCNDRILVSGGGDSMVHVWDANHLNCLTSFSTADNSVRSVSISSDGQVIASAYEKEISLHSRQGRKVGSIAAGIWTISWHPTRPVIAFGGESHSKKENGKYSGQVSIVKFESDR